MKPLRILSLVYANRSTGYGHWFRSLALAQTAQQRGHTVTIAGDRQPPTGLPFIHLHDLSPGALVMALQSTKPDWLIVDLPGDLPEWIRELTTCKIAVLNGIGYNQNEEGLDLRVIQGSRGVELPGRQDKVPTITGLEYVILRPELEAYKGLAKGQDWICWGGGIDPLRLLSQFTVACPGWFAVLVASSMMPAPIVTSPTHAVIKMNEDSPDIFGWMVSSKAACISFGMIAYELLFLGVPVYAFASTPLHLRFAQPLAERGLIKLWPTVGLPSKEEIRTFLEEDFEAPKETGLDLLGGERVMREIENYG